MSPKKKSRSKHHPKANQTATAQASLPESAHVQDQLDSHVQSTTAKDPDVIQTVASPVQSDTREQTEQPTVAFDHRENILNSSTAEAASALDSSCQDSQSFSVEITGKEDELAFTRTSGDYNSDAVVGGDARERLMCQISSLLRDSEFVPLRRSEYHDEDFNFRMSFGDVEAEGELKDVSEELPRDVVDGSDVNAASHDTENPVKPESIRHGPLLDFSREEIADLQEFLNLLSELKKEIRSQEDDKLNIIKSDEEDSYEGEETDQASSEDQGHPSDKDQETSGVQNFPGDQGSSGSQDSPKDQESKYQDPLCQESDNQHINAQGVVLTEQDDGIPSLASFVSLEDDQKKEIIQKIKEDIRVLMDFLRRRRFSSTVELEEFLTVNENMKNEIDGERWRKFWQSSPTAKSSNERVVQQVSSVDSDVGDCNSLDEVIKLLSDRCSHNRQHLANKLIVWQEFNEDRMDLEHELAQEHRIIESIKSKIRSDFLSGTREEAMLDLKLVDDAQETYNTKMRKLRKRNHELAKILNEDALNKNRSQTGLLGAELNYIKTRCARLRKALGLPQDLISETEATPADEEVYSLPYSQTDETDGYTKPPSSWLLLKMMLLTFLLFLLLLFVVFLLELHEPLGSRPLRTMRLPVSFHLRHVGTYPPV